MASMGTDATRPDTAPDWPGLLARRLVARTAAAARQRREREAQCRRAIPAMVARLAKEPGVRRIWLFGSLSGEGGLVHEGSDIDLAVEGLHPSRVDHLAAELVAAADTPVDLVRYESASPALRARIEEGDLLMEG
jgi:predicted nucleotidyltransferase